MKTKILSVLMAVTVVASLFMAYPVSAAIDPLTWGTETLPSDTNKQVVPGTDINSFAVSTDGKTVFVAPNIAGKLYKSTDGGVTFSDVSGTVTGTIQFVDVAPDDANFVVYINSVPEAFISVDGGATWSALTLPTFTAVKALDISSLQSSKHFVAVGGANGSAVALWNFNYGAAIPTWTDMTTSTWSGIAAATAIDAVRFSPSFASDRTMLAVSENGTTAVNLELANFSSSKWDAAGGFASYPVSIVSGTGVAPLSAASLSLSPTYLAADSASRLAFVGISDPVTANSGIYQCTDTTVKKIGPNVGIYSLSYTSGDKLVAGAFADNTTYYSSNASASSPTVTAVNQYARPSGVTKVIVQWAGSNVFAGTTGVSSAFSISTDNGVTYADSAVIDATLTNIEDIAVASDSSRYYLVTDDGTNLSVWRVVGTTTNRVLSLASSINYLVRVAPDNPAVVYLFKKTSSDILYSNAGGSGWTFRIGMLDGAVSPIADAAIETGSNGDIAYELSVAGKVSKTTNAGFIWGDTKDTTVGGNMLVSLSKDNLIVGGNAGFIAYSTDGNANWTKLDKIVSASGAIFCAADGLATNNYVYAVNGTLTADYVYRYQLGVSSDWVKLSAANTGNSFNGLELTAGGTSGVLYASSNNGTLSSPGTTSVVARTLDPKNATVPLTSFSPSTDLTFTSTTFSAVPDALVISTMGTGNKIWAIDTNGTDHLNSFQDTVITDVIAPAVPADKATVQINPQTGRATDVVFQWPRLSKATYYSLQVSYDSTFNQTIATFYISSTSETVVFVAGPYTAGTTSNPTATSATTQTIEYQPNTTYYWRVRVYRPVISKYNTPVHSFTTTSVSTPPPFAPTIIAPTAGATNIPVRPTFQWSAVDTVKTYELQVSDNSAFRGAEVGSPPLVNRVHLLTNVYALETDLNFSTVYYWRVRATTNTETTKGTEGPWVYGIFTTAAKPAPPTSPAPPVVLPPPVTPETPAYVWAIIGIGAVLIIAVLVLIVRTRRTA